MARVNLNMRRTAAFILDTQGLDKMLEAVNPDNRKHVLRKAMNEGSALVQKNIRSVYKGLKPDSDLDKAIVRYTFPSAEGAVVRRFYVKRGRGQDYESTSPLFRSYVLNFLEQGAKSRQTRGKGKRYSGQRLNRGSVPALRFFRKGRNRSRKKAFKEIERIILTELAKQAQRG